jgi:hypothetical protein
VAQVLQPLKERAERIIKELENRKVTGLAALDLLAAVAAEEDQAMQAARDAGLGAPKFSAYWGVIRESPELEAGGNDPLEFAKEIDRLVAQFPNVGASVDERRKFRSALNRPLIDLPADQRAGMVDRVVDTVLPDDGSMLASRVLRNGRSRGLRFDRRLQPTGMPTAQVPLARIQHRDTGKTLRRDDLPLRHTVAG